MLEYDGNITTLCRWAQEILEYQFTVIHRPYRMMANVYALTRCFGPLLDKNSAIDYIIIER